MRHYLLIWTIVLVSCGNQSAPHVDNELQPYVDRYFQHKQQYTGQIHASKPIDVIFADIDPKLAGQCKYAKANGQRRGVILIRRDYWNRIDDDAREALILHEMGHCDLDRYGHVIGEIHIMNINTLHGAVYRRFKDQLLESFFSLTY